MSTSGKNYGPKEWDEVRMAFQTSIMVDTSLNSLAQNMDAPDWPLPGKDEKPSKYIDLNFEELQRVPGLAGYPDRIEQLISILEETVAFDNPFGEMVAQTAEVVQKDNPLLKNLAKLEIAPDFPIALATISPDTKEFCRLEKITTLGEFATFAQSMPTHVIVGGDFRVLLNAVAHVNEEALAAILPFRPGSKGLHLPEALGHLIATVPVGDRWALLKRFGIRLKPEAEAQASRLGKEELMKLETDLRARAAAILRLFKAELDELIALVKQGGSLQRYLVVLQDPPKETLAAILLRPVVAAAVAPEVAAPKKAGVWGVFSRLFKKK
jgi:hypothetical protein